MVPGAALKIIEAFTEQTNHRRQLEQAVVLGSERRAQRGQILAFILVLVAIAGGLCLGLAANAAAGSALAVAGLGGGVALYVVGGRTPHDDKMGDP